MRDIPEDILAKIQSLNQTHFNNANPIMEAVIVRSFRNLNIQTLHDTGRLGSLDLAARREDPDLPPSELVLIAVVDGEALVYTGTPADEIDWGTPVNLGAAREVSIEFDGDFQEDAVGNQVLVTSGDPYFFRVVRGITDDTTVVRQGTAGVDETLLTVAR